MQILLKAKFLFSVKENLYDVRGIWGEGVW